MVEYILFHSELLGLNCIHSIHISCKPGNVLGERNTEVETLTLMITGKSGRKTRQFPKYQTPTIPKEANLSILRTGRGQKGKRQVKEKVNMI